MSMNRFLPGAVALFVPALAFAALSISVRSDGSCSSSMGGKCIRPGMIRTVAATTVPAGGGAVTAVAPATAVGGVPTPSRRPVVVAEGDSITLMWAGSYPGIYAATHPAVDLRGLAVGGSQINALYGKNGMVQRLPLLTAARPAVVTVLIGANDLGDGSYATPQGWLDALWSYVARVKATGARVAVGTVLPICLPNLREYTDRHRARRPVVNTAIRAAVGTRIDAVIDFAADPVMGPDLAACDRSLYKDGLHPTDGTVRFTGGEGKLARIYAAAVDGLLAKTPAGGAPAPSPTPSPTPTPGDTTKPVVAGDDLTSQAAIPTNFDAARFVGAAWETGRLGAIPPSSAPDVVGAFRFICTAGQIAYDDPIVYPGQPGKSHLHQFFGNTSANARSNYASLRRTGDSTCMNPLNRSAYWMPAMLSGSNVVRPDFVSIYYKRLPASSPACRRMGRACVALPRGLRFIFGYDMITGKAPTGSGYFNCDGPGATPGHYANIAQAARFCPAGARIGAVITAPNCWDGRRLDSANHRDHVAYSGWFSQDGKERCPATHPYVIPTFTLGAWFPVRGDARSYSLSSDTMGGMKMTPGSTLHADWWGAWDDATMATWTANCIDRMLNCSGGDMGNGRQLVQVAPLTYRANPALVAIPARPAG